MPSCICGSFFSTPVHKMDLKESIELCKSCIQASQPTSYTNRDHEHEFVCDDSGKSYTGNGD